MGTMYKKEVGSSNDQKKKIVQEKKLDCWTFMRVDDLCKCIVLDPRMGFTSRKFYHNSTLSTEMQIKLQVITNQHLPLKSHDTKTLRNNLLEFVEAFKLYSELNIQYRSNLNPMLDSYLESVSSESPVIIAECNRFKGDNYKGFKILAKEIIAKGSTVNLVRGFYQLVNERTRKFLETQNLDFSLMKSNKSQAEFLMLGPVALINHDCDPNCVYESLTKSSVKIKTIKKIMAGEELLCYYGDHYFGKNNTECECSTCNIKKEHFTSSDENLPDNNSPNIDFNSLDTNNNASLDKESYCVIFLSPLYIQIATTITKVFGLNITCINIIELHSIGWNNNILLKTSFQTEIYQVLEISTNSYIVQCIKNLISLKMQMKCESLKLDTIQLSLLAKMLTEDCIFNFHFATHHIQVAGFHNNSITLFGLRDTNGNSNLLNKEYITSKSIARTRIISEDTDDIDYDFRGFPKKVQLDRKLNLAYVKLEKIDPMIYELYKKKSRDGYAFCIFCRTMQNSFSKHLRRDHENEEIVKRFLSNIELKNSAISFLRHQGLACYEKITGIQIPVVEVKKDAIHEVVKVRCNNCQALFSQKTLWRHKHTCIQFAEFKVM